MSNLESKIQDTIHELLQKIGSQLNRIKIEKKQEQFRVNIETNDTSLLIGHHGENIFALQHLIKLLLWQDPEIESESEIDLYLDIDNYRRRQEQNMLNLAERKVEMVRKTGQSQSLPPMSPYFRRLIHLHLAQGKFEDIATESAGEGNSRYVIIKPKLTTEVII